MEVGYRGPETGDQKPQGDWPLPVPGPWSLFPFLQFFHQRTFNVAKPTSTSTTEMIQKRTITRGSGQPFSS